MAETLLVSRLKQSRTKFAMHLDGSANDLFRQLLLNQHKLRFVFSVPPCLRGDADFCRAASYKNMLAAIPAFSDSTRGECGIMISSSISATSFLSNPAPSLPMKMVIGSLRSAFGSGVPLCDDVATSLTPWLCNFAVTSFKSALSAARRKTEPAEALTTLLL